MIEYSPLIPALPPRLYETHPETSKKANPETSKKAKSKTKALITVGSLYKTHV